MKKSSLKYGYDISALLVESAITKLGIFIPVVYLIWADTGLSHFQIGLLQSAFAFSMIFLEIPTGYLADRFSHKLANAFGDLLGAVALYAFVFASEFWHFLLIEIVMGLASSLTNGADSALLQHHAKSRGLKYEKLHSRFESIGFVAASIGAVIGGIVGEANLRSPVLVEAFLMFAAFGVALTIRDTGIRVDSDKSVLQGLIPAVRRFGSSNLRLLKRIFVSAMIIASTYFVFWLTTPAFVLAGMSLKFQGLFFAIGSVISALGSEFASGKVGRAAPITAPLLLVAIAYLVLGFNISVSTVWLVWLVMLARGVNFAKFKPYIQEAAPKDLQATAISVYGVAYKIATSLLLIPISFVGNIDLRFSFLLSGVICTLFWLVSFLLFREEQR